MRKDPMEQIIDGLRDSRLYFPSNYTEEDFEEERRQILEMLKKQTGQDFGYDRVAWLKWYRANRDDFTPRRP
jgi:predicted Zn-dependent peptidase